MRHGVVGLLVVSPDSAQTGFIRPCTLERLPCHPVVGVLHPWCLIPFSAPLMYGQKGIGMFVTFSVVDAYLAPNSSQVMLQILCHYNLTVVKTVPMTW